MQASSLLERRGPGWVVDDVAQTTLVRQVTADRVFGDRRAPEPPAEDDVDEDVAAHPIEALGSGWIVRRLAKQGLRRR